MVVTRCCELMVAARGEAACVLEGVEKAEAEGINIGNDAIAEIN